MDESGVTTEMTRAYGRARRGERVREGTPAGHWKTLSILSAISTVGLVATMIIEAPTDGEVFLCDPEQVLGPQLTPGQTVVMDNLAAHKVHGVREMIEARGAKLPLFAAVLTGLQPYREGLVETQTAPAPGQGENR